MAGREEDRFAGPLRMLTLLRFGLRTNVLAFDTADDETFIGNGHG